MVFNPFGSFVDLTKKVGSTIANTIGLKEVEKGTPIKEGLVTTAKNIIAVATTIGVGKAVSKIPITPKTAVIGTAVATAGTGYVLSSDNPTETLKSLGKTTAQVVPKTSLALSDLGGALKESKDTFSFAPTKEYAKEHPIFSGGVVLATSYLAGKSISSGINYLTAEKIDKSIKQGEFTPVTPNQSTTSYNPDQEDIEEEITKREIKLAEISAKTREKELESQIKLREEELETQRYVAKQTAQQQAISTPTTPSVVPVTKKKTTKKKSKKKPVTKKKSKKTSKSKKKR